MEQKQETSLETGPNESAREDEQYPPLKVVIPTCACLYLAVFLTALDRTIVGVAIPAISNEFHSFDDISWYESAFLLTLCVFQLPMGKIYKYFSAKWTLAIFVIIFEIGSIVCASAHSSDSFIVGRAITGIGAAGTLVGAQVNIGDLVPLRKKAKYQGFLGAVFGLSSILGPLVGGVFTTNVTWRWCFWLSVPVGAFAFAGLLLILPDSHPPDKLDGSWLQNIKQFDPVGNMFLMPGVVCLLLAIQWGGNQYSWNSGRVIALLVVGSTLLVAFGMVQYWAQENGTIPPRILRQRSIAAATAANLGLGAPLIIASFYLPIWFQAIKGTSASNAGVRLLPYFLSTVIFVIGSGILVSKIGYYTPFLILGTAIMIVGNGLLTTLKVGSGAGQWISYEIIAGAGMGLSLQQCINAAQTVLARADVATGITLLTFVQSLSATVFVSVAQTILSSTLKSQLAGTLPGFDTSIITRAGATDFRKLVSKDELPVVLLAYNASINNVFYCALGASCLAFVASLFFEWKTVRAPSEKSVVSET